MDEVWVRVLMIIFGSTMGSTGMWSFLRNRDVKRAATTRIMMGMARETITSHGLAYIERGYITKEEYDELNEYLFKPYAALGGNGTAERIMAEVSQLPFRSHSRFAEISRNRDHEGWSRNVRVVSREEAEAPSG
ncbi:hypothetical protein SEA_KARDASHIAN_27 [Streptomyces phage Kardashian]|nr:hypothetical protein SEA_KARDASHIAN_27 [Streptomyces phage Kardashian]